MKQISSKITLLLAVMITGLVQAALPTEVNGQAVPSLAPILEQVTPAVVNIHSTSRQQIRSRGQSFYSWFYGLPNVPQERVTQSLGSGVIVDANNGYILTNNHVIADADDIQVSLQDGRSLTATLIGTDEGTDVAVIQVEAEDLFELNLSSSKNMCSVLHKPIPSAPKSLAVLVSNGVSEFVLTFNFLNVSAQLIIFENSPDISGFTVFTSPYTTVIYFNVLYYA